MAHLSASLYKCPLSGLTKPPLPKLRRYEPTFKPATTQDCIRCILGLNAKFLHPTAFQCLDFVERIIANRKRETELRAA